MHTDVNIPFVESGKYKCEETRTLAGEKTLKIVDSYDPITKRMNGCWTLKDEQGKEIKKEYSVRVYTKNEFVTLCKKAGFRYCKVYSDWDKKPYSKSSEDMIIVAIK